MSRGALHRQFWAFVGKEFIHILRDPYTLLILVMMPIVEILLFGFALNMEVTNIRTAVVGQVEGRYTQKLKDKLRSHPDFISHDGIRSVYEAEQMLKANKLDLYLVIPEGFEKDIYSQQPTELQVVVDATDPNAGEMRVNYVSAIFTSIMGEDVSGGKIPYSIDVHSRMLYNPMMRSSYNFVPGIMGLVLIVLCTIMTSVSIAREKERGNMELLLASPAHSTIMVLAKAVPYFVVSLINIASILLLSYFALEVPIRGSLILLVLITMLYVFVALAIGLAISSIVENQQGAVIISGFGMMMPTILLSGMLFPIANMPLILQWVTTIVPARYYIEAARKVMIQGVGLEIVWPQVLALVIIATVMISIAIAKIKPRLR